MNRERLETLAHVIQAEEIPEGRSFEMSGWICETSACIGGTAILLWADWVAVKQRGNFSIAARDILGLTTTQANLLFFGNDHGLFINDKIRTTNPEDAVQAIDNLLKDPDGHPWRHLIKEPQ